MMSKIEQMAAAGALIEVNGDEVTIKVKVNPNGPLSSSGKSNLLYTSHGWVKLDNGWKFNLGIIKPLK